MSISFGNYQADFPAQSVKHNHIDFVGIRAGRRLYVFFEGQKRERTAPILENLLAAHAVDLITADPFQPGDCSHGYAELLVADY